MAPKQAPKKSEAKSADDVATAILKKKERPNRLIGLYTFCVSILPSLYHRLEC